jgi:lipopolysaccharide biosynthesis glycosyltransferase
MNAIVIVSINLNNCQERSSLSESCRINAQKYADRTGAKIEIINQAKLNISGKEPYSYLNLEKNQVYDLYDKYDRILRIDEDVIIKDTCPDLFKPTDPNNIYATREDINVTDRQRSLRLNEIAISQGGGKVPGLGDIKWSDFYVNSGIVLASKCHREIYKVTEEDRNVINEGGLGFAKEQTLMNWKIQKLGFKIVDLGPNFNRMRCFDWRFPREHAFMIHMAGNNISEQALMSKAFSEDKKYTLYPNKHLQKHFGHFVHAMEYFYKACGLSLESGGRLKMLNPRHLKFKAGHRFINGFLDAVEDMKGLALNSGRSYELSELIELRASPEWCPELIRNDNTQNWFTHHSHAGAIRNHIIPPSETRTRPRVGILNRSPDQYRSIINSQEISQAIQSDLNLEVDEACFDKFSFMDQVDFFNNHDIILSGHGAQLCSIPFLPDFGYMLEFSHKDYYRPSYYGQLARNSGKNAISICSTHDEKEVNPWKGEVTLFNNPDSHNLPCIKAEANTSAVHGKYRARNFKPNIEALIKLIDNVDFTREGQIKKGRGNHNQICQNFTIQYE